MDPALGVHKAHFAFTAIYHYLFPQLTMGLALLILILKSLAWIREDDRYGQGARFWAKIFAINFAMGVVTGIPLEFQFGTSWAGFSGAAGGVIGQTLAMEGVFAFFLESSLLGLFLFGESRLGPRGHWVVAALLWLGTWMSGFFIVTANAWMQHPTGYRIGADGTLHLSSFRALFGNPWLLWEFLHTMIGSVVTGAFVMTAVGAYYLLRGRHAEQGRIYLRVGVAVGLPAILLMIFPTGDHQAVQVARHQPAGFAAMEGHFRTKKGAGLSLFGIPDVEAETLKHAVRVPYLLSLLTHRDLRAEVTGLDRFERKDWPTQIPILFGAYHAMVGLGMTMAGIMGLAGFLLWRGRLDGVPWMLRVLTLAFPLPYLANTAGWVTAELGRQPWIIYGVMRTADGLSPRVGSGMATFTLIGFMTIYALLGALFVVLIAREIRKGPTPKEA